MTRSHGVDNARATGPTPASDDEKAAMKRALEKEKPEELFDRLLQENNVARAGTSVERRNRR